MTEAQGDAVLELLRSIWLAGRLVVFLAALLVGQTTLLLYVKGRKP